MATLYAQTGSAAVKAKADSPGAGLNEAAARGTATLSAFARDSIDRNLQGKSVWGPMVHPPKLAQGLIDQYRLCGSDTALPWPVAWAFGPTVGCTR